MPGNFYTPTIEEISHWPKPNYVNPPEQRSWLGAFAVVWQILSTVTVLGRLYLRINKKAGPFGLDDAFITLAWIFSITLTVTACVSDWQYQLGRHVWNLEPKYFGPSAEVGWLAQIFFLLTMMFTKCSVLLCYRRMAKVTFSKMWMYIVYVLLFITVGSSVGIFFAYCFMCQPLHYYWDFLQMDIDGVPGYCINGDSITIATGVLTVASDLWTAAFPCALFYFHDIGASKGQKIALWCLLCAGFLVTGVGVARTYYLWQIGHHQDLSWYGYDLYTSSVVEVQLAIICICLPFVRSFFRAYFPDLVATNNTAHSRRNATRLGRLTTSDWTAISEGGDSPTKLQYAVDEKGRVVPKESPTSPTGEMRSIEEEEEIEWARQQVQRNDYIPQLQQQPRKGSSARSVEAGEEVQIPSSGLNASLTAEQDEDWKKVREWVNSRPVKRETVVE
ncbi:hypothetical protein PRZ48_012314 [Zasmidium cellare]|uniref:Rhodopsin domain-containing protein n=1 Tax=Zasmidium cellare TaxID=395010 RepID=A0ABR0E4S8_ZASCE|nr:hypothetical protein PRZ48_012314 [Zasmidium cellare]